MHIYALAQMLKDVIKCFTCQELPGPSVYFFSFCSRQEKNSYIVICMSKEFLRKSCPLICGLSSRQMISDVKFLI